MQKDDLNVHLWLSKNFYIGGIISEKKYRGKRLISEKMEALYSELNQKMEAATNSYSPTGNFLQYVYSVLVTKNHQKIWSSCLGHEFSFTFFLMTLIMATEQLYWRKILRGSSCFICLWLPISIMKRCAEPCALQFYHISVNVE